MPPPSERVRAYKRETAATGGEAADSRPHPKVLDPQDDALDARGYYMQEAGTNDALVAIWRENGVMRFRDATMGPSDSYSLADLAAGDGSGGGWNGEQNAHTVFVLSAAQYPFMITTSTEGYPRSELPEDAPYRPWRWMANLQNATSVRLSVNLINAPGHTVLLVAEGSLDGGNTWMPLSHSDPSWPGYLGTGGPDIVLIPGDVNSESDMRGGSPNLLRSAWYPIDPVFRRHDVWIRLAYHNPEQAPGMYEFGEIKLEVGYWTSEVPPDSPNHAFDPIKDLPDRKNG